MIEDRLKEIREEFEKRRVSESMFRDLLSLADIAVGALRALDKILPPEQIQFITREAKRIARKALEEIEKSIDNSSPAS